MTLEELIKKCKAGVFLYANEHKDYYDGEEFKINEVNSRALANGDDKEIDEELAQRMIKDKIIINLHFYPETPIGFYSV
jgi:hypothetical protein